MVFLPSIVIRQPRPFDIVDEPIQISGLSNIFEATIHIRVREQSGNEIVEKFFTAGGSGVWKNFQIKLPLNQIPKTPSGSLEVFEISAKDGSEVNKVVIPIVFGRALVNPYEGFTQYTVKRGDTLAAIAQTFYNSSSLFSRIFEANRDQLIRPEQIFPGQVLRIPLGG